MRSVTRHVPSSLPVVIAGEAPAHKSAVAGDHGGGTGDGQEVGGCGMEGGAGGVCGGRGGIGGAGGDGGVVGGDGGRAGASVIANVRSLNVTWHAPNSCSHGCVDCHCVGSPGLWCCAWKVQQGSTRIALAHCAPEAMEV